MNEATWYELLTAVVAETESGRVRWRMSDRPSAMVAALTSGSIVFVRPSGGSPVLVALSPGREIELHDLTGERLASLSDGRGFTAVQIAATGAGEVASQRVRQLIDRLDVLVPSPEVRAEKLAMTMLDELGRERKAQP